MSEFSAEKTQQGFSLLVKVGFFSFALIMAIVFISMLLFPAAWSSALYIVGYSIAATVGLFCVYVIGRGFVWVLASLVLVGNGAEDLRHRYAMDRLAERRAALADFHHHQNVYDLHLGKVAIPATVPGRAVQVEPEQPTPEALPAILPKLIKAQRLIIAGGSDSGKSTLVKHIIMGRVDHSKIIVIDPHGKKDLLGCEVIGAGRDYNAISSALESLLWLMTARYEDVKLGDVDYLQHERVSVFIDEWTSIKKQIPNAGDMLSDLLTESRKVNIHLTINTHSKNVEALGIDAQIRESATIVKLYGGNGSIHRCFMFPSADVNPDGTKTKPVEYALPGPFNGYATPGGDVITALPSKKTLIAQQMSKSGESATAIAKMYFDTQKPNSRQIKQVKDVLDVTI
jgi:hypothetical protein